MTLFWCLLIRLRVWYIYSHAKRRILLRIQRGISCTKLYVYTVCQSQLYPIVTFACERIFGVLYRNVWAPNCVLPPRTRSSQTSFSGRDWIENLDLAEFAINGSTSSSTGFSPCYANYAKELSTPENLGKPRLDVPAADEFANAMFATITHSRDALENAKRKYEHQMGLKRRPTAEFRPGDRVLLSTQNLKLKVDARLP